MVWQPSLNLFSALKTWYFQIWAVSLPPVVSSLTAFNKTQFLSYPGNPPPSYMPIDLVTFTFCNLLDWLCNFFELREICKQCKQSTGAKCILKILYYLTSLWHACTCKFSMTRFRYSITKACTLVTMASLKKRFIVTWKQIFTSKLLAQTFLNMLLTFVDNNRQWYIYDMLAQCKNSVSWVHCKIVK